MKTLITIYFWLSVAGCLSVMWIDLAISTQIFCGSIVIFCAGVLAIIEAIGKLNK